MLSKQEAMMFLEALRETFEQIGNEDAEDTVLDLMDGVTGYCSPGQRLELPEEEEMDTASQLVTCLGVWFGGASQKDTFNIEDYTGDVKATNVIIEVLPENGKPFTLLYKKYDKREEEIDRVKRFKGRLDG